MFWVAIAWVLYSYLAYPIILSVASRLFGRQVHAQEDYCPDLAVLVPVYNEEKVIQSKLDNIAALDYPADRIQIWIGSDCSTDATHDIVRKFPDKRVRLWIAPKRGGKTEVLNHMIPLVNADVLVFTDANTMHRPDSIRKLVRSFADPAIGGAAGLIKHQTKKKELAEVLYRSFESNQKFHESRLHSSISAFGGFYSIRRKLFRPLPFNAYSNDDVLIPMNVIRQKYRIVFDPEAISQEDTTESIAHEFTRRIRIGAGNFQAFFWLLDFLNPLKGWPWFCFFSHKVTRWFSPFLLAIAFICAGLLGLGNAHSIYGVFFLGCIGLTALGLFYRMLPLGVLRPLYYFLTMNGALALGFFRFCGGIQSAAWSRTERDATKAPSA
jgi:cellulose synthase/poly-beta-1,6-N-acetylglucosamine synthase-like glycosyltransferase